MYLSCMSDFVVQHCIAFDDMSLKTISVIWSEQQIKNLYDIWSMFPILA